MRARQQRGKAGDGVINVDDKGKRVRLDVKGTPHKVGIDVRRACKTSRPPDVPPEEWKKMSHVDRMMRECAAAEVEKGRKGIKEGLEKRIKKAEKKAEKMEDKAKKKSKDGKDAAAAKESAKDAKKLRKTVLKSIHTVDWVPYYQGQVGHGRLDAQIRREMGIQ